MFDPTGKLSMKNVDAQFCSDWLKDQIKDLLAEKHLAESKLDCAEKAIPTWTDGEPPKFRHDEWFIAKLTNGDGRVVLKALPEDYSYQYKTVDETYFKADRIKAWMPFPDSQYMTPAESAAKSPDTDAELRAKLDCAERIIQRVYDVGDNSCYDLAKEYLSKADRSMEIKVDGFCELKHIPDTDAELRAKLVLATEALEWIKSNSGHTSLCKPIYDCRAGCDAQAKAQSALDNLGSPASAVSDTQFIDPTKHDGELTCPGCLKTFETGLWGYKPRPDTYALFAALRELNRVEGIAHPNSIATRHAVVEVMNTWNRLETEKARKE